SSTDNKGVIRFCNESFQRLSGFRQDELIGQAHNIVRHSDMPQEAFSMLWTALKAGKPWMGIVKNRSKNGDHYWVDAYVTPVLDKGEVSGYESVRIRADRAAVARAQQCYERLRRGQSMQPLLSRFWFAAKLPCLFALCFLLLSSIALWFTGDVGLTHLSVL